MWLMLLATPIDRCALPDAVEPLKDLVVDLAQALVAVRAQADAQMASLAAQLAEFKRRVFGPRTEVLDALQPAIEARLRAQGLGSTRIEWFQSGSEKVAARIDAELASGGSPCDVLLTSDPTYYARLKREGAPLAGAGATGELVADQVELDLQQLGGSAGIVAALRRGSRVDRPFIRGRAPAASYPAARCS